MATGALESVAQYHANHANKIPGWVDEIMIGGESDLRDAVATARSKLLELEEKLVEYRSEKAILCLKGDPLVARVQAILEQRFELDVRHDDVSIEDLSLLDEDGAPFALVEVKGVNRNFQQTDINQVDSHRERHGLPASVAGVLIMNTFADAIDLTGKLVPPHPDSLQKTVRENVVLLRTLDLLFAVDLLDKQAISASAFRASLCSGGGWLRVLDGKLICSESLDG